MDNDIRNFDTFGLELPAKAGAVEGSTLSSLRFEQNVTYIVVLPRTAASSALTFKAILSLECQVRQSITSL
jgi:hypothetical protein